jgi:ubiquitin-conjugating enzyme (huntingtin interacting protein 2)
MGCSGRINREIKDLMKDNDLEKNSYAIHEVLEPSRHILAIIRGPPGTPYEGGIFKIDIRIPNSYPFTPPNCKFATKIWHPNISSQTGVICLDILKEQWAAAITIASVLVSIQTFLSSPEPNDPQDAVVANQFLTQRDLWHKTAKYWTFIYAMDEEYKKKIDNNYFKDYDQLVHNLRKKKTLDRDQALALLSNNGWDLDKSLQ